MVVTSAFRDQSGRLVPTTEAEFDGDDVRSNRTGEPLEKTTAKMSKSLKNVVNPDDVIAEYGRDTFRLYELFMGPLADSKHWNPRDIPGCRRFLDRVWRLFVDDKVDQPVRLHLQDSSESNAPDSDLERGLNVMLKRIDDAFSSFKFNTAIAAMMSFVNQATSSKKLLTSHQAERFLLSLAPFAPHIAEELWSRIGKSKPLAKTPWPKVDANFLVGDEFELVVQIMGKVRGRTNAPRSLSKDELISMARSIVADNLKGKRVVREIVVPGRLVNFVVE